jgi:hypothetical protein
MKKQTHEKNENYMLLISIQNYLNPVAVVGAVDDEELLSFRPLSVRLASPSADLSSTTALRAALTALTLEAPAASPFFGNLNAGLPPSAMEQLDVLFFAYQVS